VRRASLGLLAFAFLGTAAATPKVARADSIEVLGEYDIEGSAVAGPAEAAASRARGMTILMSRPTGSDPAGGATAWVHPNGEDVAPLEAPGGSYDPLAELDEEQRRYVVEFLDQFIAFVRDFGEVSDHHTTGRQFRSLFLHEISRRWPGFAWVLLVYSSHARFDPIELTREGGGFGIQIPLTHRKSQPLSGAGYRGPGAQAPSARRESRAPGRPRGSF